MWKNHCLSHYQNAQTTSNKIKELSLLCTVKAWCLCGIRARFQGWGSCSAIQNYNLANSLHHENYKGGGWHGYICKTGNKCMIPLTLIISLTLASKSIVSTFLLILRTVFFVFGLYISPSGWFCNTFFQKFDSFLNFVCRRKGKFALIGEFNIDVFDHAQQLHYVLN